MLAGIDCRLEVQGAEVRLRRQEDDIDLVDHLLIGVETDELALGRHVDLAGDLLLALEQRQARLQAVLEGVGHGDQLDVGVGRQCLLGRPGAAAAAADEADAQQVAAGGVDGAFEGQRAGDDGRGGLQEITTRSGGWHDRSFQSFAGRISKLRKYTSNPSDCSRILPAEGKTS